MYTLGISAFYHDSAACLIKDGNIVAATQEERFSRKKHDPSFPSHSIKYCLKQGNISPSELQNIIFYEKPFLKFERLLETYLAFAPKGFNSFIKAMPIWVKEKLFQKTLLIRELNEALGDGTDWGNKLLFSEHHLSHAASAFYPSPFNSSAILTLDGVGEWTTTSLAVGNGSDLKVIKEIHFPHSVGLLYSAFTYYTGFKVNSGEYKLMGLAPYGEPIYEGLIKNELINISEDGSFHLNMNYFDFATGLTMTNSNFNKLFDGPPRRPETQITQREMDLAASIQKVTEEIVIKLAKSIAKETGEKNLCLAGGVALNCVANGVLLREKIFENIWIQPAAGDAGGALGAALVAHYLHDSNQRIHSSDQDSMHGSFLGPEFTDTEIEKELSNCGAKFHKFNTTDLIEHISLDLIEGKAIGWMQGRMEFGPRALGARSILADPRSEKMQKQLNLKVKFRESFRPFAPAILREDLAEWFQHHTDSPYMLFVADINASKRIKIKTEDQSLFGIDKLNMPRSQVPATTHVDYSSRIQTVHNETNPLFHSLISSFKEKTGFPILVNTSFNIRGEPIVCTPTDAYKCFMGTGLDTLAIGSFVMIKEEQPQSSYSDYQKNYELD